MHDVTLPGSWSVHLAHRDLVYVVTLMGDPEGPVVGHGPDILNACEAVVRTAQHRGQSPPDAQAIYDAFHGPPTESRTMTLAIRAGIANEIADIRERLDRLESPEGPTIPPFAAECVQRLADAAGEGETIAEVLDRLMILWNSGKDMAVEAQSTGPARRQALVVTYSDSPDGPLSMLVDLEGEHGTALDPLTFTDAGRALVVGLEAIAAKVGEAS